MFRSVIFSEIKKGFDKTYGKNTWISEAEHRPQHRAWVFYLSLKLKTIPFLMRNL